MMYFVRNCILIRGFGIFNVWSVFPRFCAFSPLQYDVRWPMVSTVTCHPTVKSVVRSLQTTRCTVYSNVVSDAEFADGHEYSSSEQSVSACDVDCKLSELHTPVLADEVVSLISPSKRQVSMSS